MIVIGPWVEDDDEEDDGGDDSGFHIYFQSFVCVCLRVCFDTKRIVMYYDTYRQDCSLLSFEICTKGICSNFMTT